MATAPKPGAARREQARRIALQITVKGQTKKLSLADLGPRDDRVARAQTGRPISPYIYGEQIAADSLVLFWWMARRHDGEPDLTYDEVEREFPSFLDIDEMQVLEVTDEVDAPEG